MDQPVTGANTVTSPGNQTSTVGGAVSPHVQASDPASRQTLSYSATGLPAGPTINDLSTCGSSAFSHPQWHECQGDGS